MHTSANSRGCATLQVGERAQLWQVERMERQRVASSSSSRLPATVSMERAPVPARCSTSVSYATISNATRAARAAAVALPSSIPWRKRSATTVLGLGGQGPSRLELTTTTNYY